MSPPKRWFLQEPHGVRFQKRPFFRIPVDKHDVRKEYLDITGGTTLNQLVGYVGYLVTM
jgi:hypothetical protein